MKHVCNGFFLIHFWVAVVALPLFFITSTNPKFIPCKIFAWLQLLTNKKRRATTTQSEKDTHTHRICFEWHAYGMGWWFFSVCCSMLAATSLQMYRICRAMTTNRKCMQQLSTSAIEWHWRWKKKPANSCTVDVCMTHFHIEFIQMWFIDDVCTK